MTMKILVVDDSASDRMIIKNMLSDYIVLTADDGEEAMQKLAEEDGIQLMILDLNMPNMDGFQVLETLKGDSRYKNLRTIILTNYDELDNEIRGLKLGAMDYVRKPVHMDSLRARIDTHVALLHAREALQLQLHTQKVALGVVFEQAPVGIAILHNSDPGYSNESFVKINTMYEQITGWTREKLKHSGWKHITHPEDLEEDQRRFRELKSGVVESYSMEKRFIRPDGSIVWVHMIVAALNLMGTGNRNYMKIIQDITERKETEEQLRYVNEHDKWTGLYNRNYLEYALSEDAVQRKGEKRALVLVNLSTIEFLRVHYGFPYIQNLIKQVVETLQVHQREDWILCKTYENQFAFYLRNYRDRNELVAFSEKIEADLKELFFVERIGGGIGIVEIEENMEIEADLLLRRVLMASERSLNEFDEDFIPCFYNEFLEQAITREGDIRHEILKTASGDRNDNLFLQFQPILDLKTDTIRGFEALARLKTEKLGYVSPLEFIPIAEKTKLIIPLGLKIIRSAFHFLIRLNAMGYENLNVSINISAIQLFRPDFTSTLFDMIREMKVNPQNIVLEITESIFVYDHDYINSIISVLRLKGLRIAIDDFGTGYSSLAREKELKVDILKIDKYFIDRILEDSENAITGDIIAMSHRMGHSVVAEGVELEEQKQYLKDHGCDKIQGYLVARPLDEEAALEFLALRKVLMTTH